MARKPVEKKEQKFSKKSMAIRIKGIYRKGLVIALRFRYALMLAAFLMLAIALFFGMKLEKEFMVEAEEAGFTLLVELEPGAKLDVTDKMAKELEEKLANVKEIKTFTSKVEPGSSKIYVKLKPIKDRANSTKEVMDAIRLEGDVVARHYKGGFIYFSELEESGLKELTLDLCGYDYKVLKETAISIATRLGSIDGLQDIRMSRISGRPEWLVKIDKQQASSFGFTTQEIAETLHGEIRGLRATLFHTDAKEIETITRLQKKYRAKVDDVRSLTVYTPEGNSVFLEQIADFVPDIGMSEITRKNKTRIVQITAMVSKGSLQKAVEKARASLGDMELPKDYYWRVGGDYERNIKNEKELSAFPFSLTPPYVQMPGILWITLLLVFMVLSSLFESLTQPFVILFSVPLAVVGVVAALFISHKPISRGVMIGAIMLAGIVVNNAIILVDRVNFLRIKKDGSSTNKYNHILRASIMAGEDRFRPIFMTTSTTILGLVPMAFDKSESANLWSPLAITVIGGLTSSTVMTLFLVPSVYMIFEDFNAIVLAPKRLLVFIRRRMYGIIKRKGKPVKNI